MSSLHGELRHPVRCVALGWALLTLLFAATAPFVDMPWPKFLLDGIVYSLILVVVAVGLVLLRTHRMMRICLFVGCIVLLVDMTLATFLAARSSLETVGWILRTTQCIMGLAIVGLPMLSIGGWIRFVRAQKNRRVVRSPD